MSNFKHTIITGGSALLLSLSLVACGGGGSQQSTAASSVTQTSPSDGTTPVVNYSHDAVLDPTEIECGQLDAENPSDLWYPNGDPNAQEAIFFTIDSNDAGMTLTTTFTDKRPDTSVWDLEIVDMHLITKEGARGEERSVDLTFQDNFTFYDAITNTTYIRGDYSQDEYNALFEKKLFSQRAEDEGLNIEFGKEGQVTTSYGELSSEGTYEVVATNVVRLTVDGVDENYRFTIKDGAVSAISNSDAEEMAVVADS